MSGLGLPSLAVSNEASPAKALPYQVSSCSKVQVHVYLAEVCEELKVQLWD